MIAAGDYFSQHYAADFKLHGHESLCGFNLFDMMSQPTRGKFKGFAEFALCQFALNLHNQAFYSHFPRLHSAWRGYVAPFGNTLLCFSGHGLASHAPDSILRFVQSPPEPLKFLPVRYDWSEVAAYIRFFLGDYLRPFAVTFSDGEFTLEQYIAAIATDFDCRTTILTETGWESRHVTSLLHASANT